MSSYGEKERMDDFKYFVDNYNDIFDKYGHKFVVIKSKEILGVYDTETEALNVTSNTYPVGTFIVQECNGKESGYTNYISSWQLISV